MILTRNNRTIEVETKRSFYLLLNGTVMIAADQTDALFDTKIAVLNTLVTLNIPYHTELNLWEDPDGYMHEVTEITTDKQ